MEAKLDEEETEMQTQRTHGWTQRLAAILLGAAALTAGAAALADDAKTRATGGFEAERGAQERRASDSLEDFSSSRSDAPRGDSAKAGVSTMLSQQSASCCGFYIYDARTELFDDLDRDGYYTYLRVTFDVDTEFAEADVYADVWLRRADGDYVLLYESNLFTIFGSSASDDYEVEAELVAGFPPDLYDVLIEIYDARDGRLVADYGAFDSSALALLPMEDISFDGDLPPPVVDSRGGGGAGSVSFAGILLLFLLAVGLRRR